VSLDLLFENVGQLFLTRAARRTDLATGQWFSIFSNRN